MTLAAYRCQVLDTLRGARNRWRHARLFVLYAPGHDDPLELAKQEPPKRDTALVAWGKVLGYKQEHYPRVIELDCRRVAAHLLENDAAFDDPLLEETITRTYEELSAPAADPEGDEGSARAFCGWLVSPESAQDIARRFVQASQRTEPGALRRYGFRWHDPRMMALLWPTLDAAQRTALLGPQVVWVALEAAGHLVQFDASQAMPSEAQPVALSMQQAQRDRASRLGLINQLVEAWRERAGQPLPRNATERLHRHVEQAERWGLNGRDLMAFVFAAVELQDGFEGDPRMLAVVRQTLLAPGTFGDHFDELPPDFWEKFERAE